MKGMKNLIDMHCDTISALQESGGAETLWENHLCVDIKRMEQAGSLVQFFACFIDGKAYKKSPQEKITSQMWNCAYEAALRLIERIRKEENEKLSLALSYEEILENQKQDRISAVATIEEGGILNGEGGRIAELYERGIRLITLTWNYENSLGYPNSWDSEMMGRGLKRFGLETVEQMNALGMLVDVSHLSDGGFWDCIRYSTAPVVASHSNARSLCSHPRNLTDEMLRALAEKGGVAGLNFYPVFLKEDGYQVCTEDIARHAAYMIRTAGEDVVAIGTDFDGFDPGNPEQMYPTHIGEMDRVREAMKKQGITERQIDKIWSGNALRVLKEVL